MATNPLRAHQHSGPDLAHCMHDKLNLHLPSSFISALICPDVLALSFWLQYIEYMSSFEIEQLNNILSGHVAIYLT